MLLHEHDLRARTLSTLTLLVRGAVFLLWLLLEAFEGLLVFEFVVSVGVLFHACLVHLLFHYDDRGDWKMASI